MLFDRIEQDRVDEGHRSLRRRRKVAVKTQIDAQCRRVAARTGALGRMTGAAVLVRRSLGTRGGLAMRRVIVPALRASSRGGMRETARRQLPQEQQDCEAEPGAMAYHACILSSVVWRRQACTCTQDRDATLAESSPCRKCAPPCSQCL